MSVRMAKFGTGYNPPVEDHDMHSQSDNLTDLSSKVLYGNIIVNETKIFVFHHLPEVFDLAQHRCQADFFLLQSLPINPDNTAHLVGFHSDQSKSHIGPSGSGRCRRIQRFQLFVIDVKRELRIKFVRTNMRSWTLRFACSDIQEAYMVPD